MSISGIGGHAAFQFHGRLAGSSGAGGAGGDFQAALGTAARRTEPDGDGPRRGGGTTAPPSDAGIPGTTTPPNATPPTSTLANASAGDTPPANAAPVTRPGGPHGRHPHHGFSLNGTRASGNASLAAQTGVAQTGVAQAGAAQAGVAQAGAAQTSATGASSAKSPAGSLDGTVGTAPQGASAAQGTATASLPNTPATSRTEGVRPEPHRHPHGDAPPSTAGRTASAPVGSPDTTGGLGAVFTRAFRAYTPAGGAPAGVSAFA